MALQEASTEGVRQYAAQIVKNARALAETLAARGFNLVTGGTENHLMLIDLTSKGVTGKVAAKALDAAGIVLNYNSVPFDTRKPFDPSGIRLGSAAVTSRGFKEEQMVQTGKWIDAIVSAPENTALQAEIATAPTADQAPLSAALLQTARDQLVRSFDPVHGGVTTSQVFSTPVTM